MARKPTDTAIFSLRIREELRRRIEREAQRQERSMNAEIIQRLERSFQDEEKVRSEAAKRAFQAIARAAMGVIGDLNRPPNRSMNSDQAFELLADRIIGVLQAEEGKEEKK